MVTAFVRYLPICMCVLIMNAKAGHKCKFQWMFRSFCVLFSIMCLYVRAAWQGTKLIFFSRSHHHDSQNNALYNNGHHGMFLLLLFLVPKADLLAPVILPFCLSTNRHSDGAAKCKKLLPCRHIIFQSQWEF